MQKRYHKRKWLQSSVLMGSLLCAMSGLQAATTPYFQDFESGVLGNEWLRNKNAAGTSCSDTTPTKVTEGALVDGTYGFSAYGFGSKHLRGRRLAAANPVPRLSLCLENLPAHTEISLSFSLSIFDSMDYDRTAQYAWADFFRVSADGVFVISESFGQNASPNRSAGPGTTLTPRLGCSACTSPNSFWGAPSARVVALTFKHTASTLNLVFQQYSRPSGLISDPLVPWVQYSNPEDESFGIDNVTVTTIANRTDLADTPIPLNNNVPPNVLVIFDNSQSMDAKMSGQMVSGSYMDAAGGTRSSIGRTSVRNGIVAYQDVFRWGLMTYELGENPVINNTYSYLMGSDTGMNFSTTCNGFLAGGTYAAPFNPNGLPFTPGCTGPAGTTIDPADGVTCKDPGGSKVDGLGKRYLRCVKNPQDLNIDGLASTPVDGDEYVTFEKSSDDPDVLDVFYSGTYPTTAFSKQYWYTARNCRTMPVAPTSYDWWLSRNTAAPTLSWLEPASAAGATVATKCASSGACGYCGSAGTYSATANASSRPNPNLVSNPAFVTSNANFVQAGRTTTTLRPTDAGFSAGNFIDPLYSDSNKADYRPPVSRLLYLPRGWGYQARITGKGKLVEPVASKAVANNDPHIKRLTDALQNETDQLATTEIKNAATYTPLTGSLQSAKSYYEGASTPIQYSCQNNFVMMITDGMPTGDTSGNLYSDADRRSTCTWSTATNSCTSGTFSKAADDAIGAVTALRNISSGYDVKTYVIAVADNFKNPLNMSVMHAMAYAGGGLPEALLATDASSFQAAMENVARSIVARAGSGTSIVVANPDNVASDDGNDLIFATNYNSGTWTGDLKALRLNMATGLLNQAEPVWRAQVELDAMPNPASNRKIATGTPLAGAAGGVRFQWASLGAYQQSLFHTPNRSPVDGAFVLSYLRGDRSGENGTYRRRTSLLGDIVSAETVVVRVPDRKYTDTGYADFKTAKSSRTRMVYQGANDAMVHAFRADNGQEQWAYVPSLVLKDINNLSREGGGFSHKYYVNGLSATGDVDFNRVGSPSGSGDWRTIVVGGVGKGGRGYYALDVTNPAAADESAVANKVLWEFPNSVLDDFKRANAFKNMGYSFGRPILTKTRALGWVVLVTSGYNNGIGDTAGDGLGHLFVLNPKTGDLLADLPTPSCHSVASAKSPSTSPCGLAHIGAFVREPETDNTVEYVYGGDLYGNLWKFDLSDSSASNWNVQKFATMVSPSPANTLQPITSQPVTTEVEAGGSKYVMVYVGTGRYLGVSDVSNKQKQTMYGLIDKGSGYPVVRAGLVAQTFSLPVGGKRTISNNQVSFASKYGWYIDLPDVGPAGETERVSSRVDLNTEFGVLAFASNVPDSAPCSPGGKSWLNLVEYRYGGSTNGKLPTDSDSTQYVGITNGVALYKSGGNRLGGGGQGDPGEIHELGFSRLPPKRTSWRELIK